ncbi:MAG: hypothetical protein WBM00_08275 [Solirubrobacterales bacterium]
MATVPAICESCGAIWGAENFIGGSGSTNIQITGSKVGPCPQCGGWGSIPDGVYDLQDDMLQVVKSANVSPDVLQGLIRLLESLRRGEITDAEVIEKAETDTPDLAPVIRQVLAKSDRTKWLGILLAIIGIYLQLQTPKPPTAEEIARELRRDPVPGLVVPPTRASQPSRQTPSKRSIRHKRPPKAYGKSKPRKSGKRRR